MTKITCDKTSCISRGEYADCFLIDTEVCRFYEKLKKTRYTNLREVNPINLVLSPNGSLETKCEKRER